MSVAAPETDRTWASLSPRQRIERVVAATLVSILVVLHAAALLHRVLPARLTDRLPAVVRPRARQMERLARWNMFRAMHETDQIVIEGRGAAGEWFDLANPFVRGLDVWGRIVDARLRKFHGRLRGRVRLMRWGRPYMAHLCRVGQEEHGAITQTRVVRMLNEHRYDGAPPPVSPKVSVLTYRCGDPIEPPEPRRRGAHGAGPDDREGDDDL